MPVGAILFFVVFFAFWFYHAYLLFCRPVTWVDWFFRKPWKPFGVTVAIEDHQKLKRRTRLLGAIYLIVGVLFLALMIGVTHGQ